MIETVELTCLTCGEKFDRVAAEARRRAKQNCRTFCCQKCANEYLRKLVPPTPPERALELNPANRLDEYSPFRYYLSRSKSYSRRNRDGRKEVSITLDDLKDQWEKQDGICPYTGWKMIHRKFTSGAGSILAETDYMKASLDRIDCSKGYIPGNIQFVCYMANCARNRFSDDAFFAFCKAVVEKTGLDLAKSA